MRAATPTDAATVAAAITELLIEVGAAPPEPEDMRAAALTLLDPTPGVLLVAECEDLLVGVLAASWQSAIHVPGRYAVIQDLWVDPSWRSAGVGRDLLRGLTELVGELGMAVVEVGLPRESFDQIRATEAFYSANGFAPVGPRMRRVLS